MIKGGSGGANTTTGNIFESNKRVGKAICVNENFDLVGNIIYCKGEKIAENYWDERGNSFNNYLKKNDIKQKDFISKSLRPDEVIIIDDKIFIFEMKTQSVSGSVDEKLQTCEFKKKQYQKLLKPLNKTVIYSYVLDKYFNKKQYDDLFSFIEEKNCFYFFEEVPIDFIFNEF